MVRASRGIIVMAFSAGVLPQAIQAQKKEPVKRKMVEKVKAVCLELARRISSVIKLEALVRGNGSVKSTKVLGGNPVLLDAANEAARQWTFEAVNSETIQVLQIVFEPQ